MSTDLEKLIKKAEESMEIQLQHWLSNPKHMYVEIYSLRQMVINSLRKSMTNIIKQARLSALPSMKEFNDWYHGECDRREADPSSFILAPQPIEIYCYLRDNLKG
jgi:hypothetical protein